MDINELSTPTFDAHGKHTPMDWLAQTLRIKGQLDYVAPELVIAGLTKEYGPVAARFLMSLGPMNIVEFQATLKSARAAVTNTSPPGTLKTVDEWIDGFVEAQGMSADDRAALEAEIGPDMLEAMRERGPMPITDLNQFLDEIPE